MKTTSAAYNKIEEGKQRRPVELYKIWRTGETWRYTSFDRPVNFGGYTYEPASISRTSVRYNTEFEATTVKVSFGYVVDPALVYIAQNPIDLIWIEIRRYYQEIGASETAVIFMGQIKSIAFQGNKAEADCTGFEHFLNMRVPRYRFQPGCNNDLYDNFCGIDKDLYEESATVTVSSDGMELSAAVFDTYEDGWFSRGYVVWGNARRHIVRHQGEVLTLRFKIPGLTSGQNVSAYAGCDLHYLTCKNKFNNLDNFFGHPWIPLDNPAQWF